MWPFRRRIQVDLTPETMPTVTRELVSYEAQHLHLSGDLRDPVVEVGGDHITILATGPAEEVERIKIECVDGTVKVSYQAPEASIKAGNISIRGSHVSNNRVTVDGRRIVFSGTGRDITITAGPDQTPQVKVTIPKGTVVTAEELEGHVRIGDTQANINLKPRSYTTYTVGQVRDTDILALSNAQVTVASITGQARISARSYAKVTVQDGSITNSQLTLGSSAQVAIGALLTREAEVENGSYSSLLLKRCQLDKLTLTNASNVEQAEVRGVVAQATIKNGSYGRVTLDQVTAALHVTGQSSSITAIKQGTLTELTATMGSYASLDFGGSTNSATVELAANSNCRLATVSTSLKAQVKSYAELQLDGGDGLHVDLAAGANGGAKLDCFVASGTITTSHYAGVWVRRLDRNHVELHDRPSPVAVG